MSRKKNRDTVVFRTSPRSLYAPCQPRKPISHCFPGAILGLRTGRWHGKLVRVLSTVRGVDVERLSASFDTDPAWHKVGKSSHVPHCYHMIRAGHRFRMLFPEETPCETWGSQLHSLYRDMAALSARRYACRLFLKAAGVECAGHPRDEAIVDALAQHFAGSRNPHKRRGDKLSKGVRDLRRGQKDALMTTHIECIKPDVVDSVVAPCRLDPIVRKHLETRFERDFKGTVNRGADGQKTIRALPMHKNAVKDAAVSVMRARLSDWLRSEEGSEWQRKRTALLENADDSSE